MSTDRGATERPPGADDNYPSTEGTSLHALRRLSEMEGEYREHVERLHDAKSDSDKDLVQRAVQALTLAGVGLYGAIRFGQQLYCDKLGITPEEIGLTYVSSISRAAVLLIAIVVPSAVFLTLNLLNASIEGSGGWLSKLVELALSIALMLTAIAFIAGTLVLLGDAAEPAVYALFLFLFLGSLFIWTLYDVFKRRKDRRGSLLKVKDDSGSQIIYSRRVPILIACLIGIMIIAAFLLSGFAARTQADAVRAGQISGDDEALSILGPRAHAVRLIGSIPKELNIAQKKLLFLGRANDIIVLYDVACSRPIRLPDSGVTVITVQGFPRGAKSECDDK